MKVSRLGRLFDPLKYADGFTHASTPFLDSHEEKLRVIFNRRDENQRSHVFSIDLKCSDSSFYLGTELKHHLGPGQTGSFDDSGISVGSICKLGDERLFFYMGWNLGVTVPWRNSIGVTRVLENLELQKFKIAPLLDRSEEDPFTMSYPWVIKNKDLYYMFYGSNSTWDTSKADIDHNLRLRISSDCKNWRYEGKLSIALSENANAFCRPSVLKISNQFYMAYAFRGDKYKIGFAKSSNLIDWEHVHTFKAEPNNEWESEEVTYPSLFNYMNKVFLLYCGNGYGKSGFGIAEIKDLNK